MTKVHSGEEILPRASNPRRTHKR